MMSSPWTAAVLVAAAALSLGASAVLVVRLERLGARLGLSEALLGLVAALAADTPEVTSAVTALAHGQHDVGTGVVLGSNAFNLAALIGLGAVVAGGIKLHPGPAAGPLSLSVPPAGISAATTQRHIQRLLPESRMPSATSRAITGRLVSFPSIRAPRVASKTGLSVAHVRGYLAA